MLSAKAVANRWPLQPGGAISFCASLAADRKQLGIWQSEPDASGSAKLHIFIFAIAAKPFPPHAVQVGMTGAVQAERKVKRQAAGADEPQLERGPLEWGNMKNMTKWMLAAALAIGGLGLAATPAKAAQFGFYIGSGGPAYAAPYPGPGYTWIDGYYANGYWVPGRWAFAGAYNGYYGNRFNGDRDDYSRRYDRDDWRRDRDHFDHDRHWDRDDRGRHEGWRHGHDHDR